MTRVSCDGQAFRNEMSTEIINQVDHRILVLGAGNFGTCIADHLAALGNEVVIWARDAAVVKSINEEHRHCKYLKDISLSINLHASLLLEPTLFENSTVVVVAIPTQHMRQYIIKQDPFSKL